jgi:RNA polymerase sigma-70 factor (ECF subfamily)
VSSTIEFPKILGVEGSELEPGDHADWKAGFYAGKRALMAELYRNYFATVKVAASRVLTGADRDTVVHEVFLRLLSSEDLRRSYHSGAFERWLFTVARHHAIDYARRRARETPHGLVPESSSGNHEIEQKLDAHYLIQKFREQILPAEWRSVFEARFLGQLDQRRAARQLGIPRTTLVYRELRIRSLLRSFLLDTETRHERA